MIEVKTDKSSWIGQVMSPVDNLTFYGRSASSAIEFASITLSGRLTLCVASDVQTASTDARCPLPGEHTEVHFFARMPLLFATGLDGSAELEH